jgi:predicted permease
MGWLRSRRLRYSDLSVSIEEHLQEAVDELMAEGLSRDEAETAARRRFGNVTLAAEHSREVWQWGFLENLWADLRLALRQAVKSPRFTIATVLTLALGIAAQVTIYSVVHAVLIDPYPYRGAMRMVHVHLYDKEPNPMDLALTGPEFEEFQKASVFDGAIAVDNFSAALTGETLPEQVQAARLSRNGFEYFGVPPLLGREFGPSDDAHVAVLSYPFWKSHFGGRTDVIGKPLQMDHQSLTIIGVLPRRFAFMESDLYIPLQYSPDSQPMATVYARLKTGVSDREAEQVIQPMLDQFQKQTPEIFPQSSRGHLMHINEVAIGRFRGVLVVLFIAVSFLLMLACVNVAILTLARGEARRAELAVRLALGAGRRRIVVQLLTESLALASVGGASGVLLALGAIRLVRHLVLPSLFPPEAEIRLNVPVLLFSIFASLVTGVACGIWPALHASSTDLRRVADAGSHKIATTKGTRNSHAAMLTFQIAMTVLLLAWSGASLQRLVQLIRLNPGYDPQNLISVNLSLREDDHQKWAERIHYYEQIRRTIAGDPDVVSAAIAENNLPPSIVGSDPVSIPGVKTAGGQVIPVRVSPEYFATLRIPLLQGRVWSPVEIAQAAHFALINQAMRRRYWPDSDPVGRTVVLNNGVASGNLWTLVGPGTNQRFQIIGVVGDTPNRGLDEAPAPAVYMPYSSITYDWFNLVIRKRGESAALLHTIKQQVRAIHAGQAVGEAVTADDLLERDSLGRERFVASLYGAFAFLALAFAVSGLYCIESYLVAQRTREFGVRIALGASGRHIVGLVTGPSFVAVVAGTGIGILLNLGLSRVFAEWTRGNSRDPLMLGVLVVVLLGTAGLASIVPARLAVGIEPMEALRAE